MTGAPEGSEYFWTSDDGLRLFARDYAGGKAKLPIICIPGLTRNSRDFEDVAPWIAQRGRRVLAVDLRGRGRSARDPDRRRHHPRAYAQDMAALMQSIGAQKALFIGTSLGGLVTMTLAARKPALIGGAVLNDVGPEVARAGLARIRAYAGKSAPVQSWAEAAAYAKRTNSVAFPNYPEEAWAPFARRLFRAGEGGRPELDYDPLIFKAAHPFIVRLAQPLVWAAFKRLAKAGPLLLVHGELTDIVDISTRQRMKRVAPNMTIAEVPGVGHAPMLSEPAALEALGAWLDSTA